MQINVSQLLKEPIGSTRNYKVSETIDVTGDGNGRKVQGEVRLLRTQRGILVKEEPQTEIELTCSRCLSLFNYPVTLNIEEEYVPSIDVVSGVPLPAPEEPGSFTIDEHHVIDLTEARRQYTLMAIPMKPLCREDCAGLCPDCGHNLNQGACGCSPRVADPRWSELSKLL
jgi:uncharacterized protein